MNSLLVAIGAAIGGVATIVSSLVARPKTDAEAVHLSAQATDLIVDAAAKMVERQERAWETNEEKLEEKISELEAKVDALTDQANELSRLVLALSAQLIDAGITPVADLGG